MKTNIRTISAIFALGTIGFTNINAIVDNKKAVISEVGAENAELNTLNTWANDKGIIYSAETFSAKDTDFEIERFESEQIQNGNVPTVADSLNSAESITAAGADQEIEKYAMKQILLIKTRTGK